MSIFPSQEREIYCRVFNVLKSDPFITYLFSAPPTSSHVPRGHPDMMSASEGEGVMEKQTLQGKLHKSYSINQIQMRTRMEGVKKSENLWMSLMEAPLGWILVVG